MLNSAFGRDISGAIGIDINGAVTRVASATVGELVFNDVDVQFYQARATDQIDLEGLNISHSNVCMLALKLIPAFTLDETKDLLLRTRETLAGKEGSITLTIALDRGPLYEQNKRLAVETKLANELNRNLPEVPVYKQSFLGGTTFFRPHPFPDHLPKHLLESDADARNVVINTYYDTQFFLELARKSGFRVVHSIVTENATDNHRLAVMLEPMK